MSRRGLPLGLLAPVSLVLLVAALGAYQSFRPPVEFSPAAPDRFAQQYDEWQASARFPAMLKAAYFAMQDSDDLVLHRYQPEARTFTPIAWPASLEDLQKRLAATLPRAMSGSNTSGGGGNFMVTTFPVLPEIPALVIAETQAIAPKNVNVDAVHMPGVATSFMVGLRAPRKYTVLELDREFMASTLLPALAERHFSETGADRVRLSVVDTSSRVLFARGLPAGQTLEQAKADASTGLFAIRIESTRAATATATMRGEPLGPSTLMFSTRLPEGRGTASVFTKQSDSADLRMVIEQHSATIAGPAAARAVGRTGWTLLLQHGAGSLDAAVDRARRRNLWLSFGILGVLAASAGLVVVNARRSERLAAQQMDFVATVSHELRTPVAVIRSAAQNLAAGVVHDPDQARQYGTLIESEGRRLTDMVEQVLEYAGLSDAKRAPVSRPVDAGQLARDVVAASESLPEADGITFETRVDEGAPAIMADEDAIRRALLNLVGNAIKYGAEGGWIGVTVSRGTGRDTGQVSISVADRGRGIPTEDLGQIFKPFYRGAYARDRQIHGNGLGLSLVKGIVEAHGGRITVASAPGQGSTFTLELPVASEAIAGTPVRSDRHPTAEGHSA
jgi:two-component system sensor histidine kinase SenX3